MWQKLPRWAKQILIGSALALTTIGARQAVLHFFPGPQQEAPLAAPVAAQGDIEKSPFTKASLATGREVTDSYRFTDQDGAPFDTAAWYDLPIVVGFIFTSCQEVCPAMNVALKRIVADMAPAKLGVDFRILMVGFDTERDTPAALRTFGAKFTDDFTHWRFVSGDPAEVARFADRLGIVYEASPQGTAAGWKHFLGMTIVANGKVYKQVFGPAPLPEEILGPVMAAQGKPYTPPVRAAETGKHAPSKP
ncbi:MAG: SCO family protein [Nitrospinae bacterium]|nr:SCO family protein [Nitrospinota bacterium]